jgi:class 3 adenylate cyclase
LLTSKEIIEKTGISRATLNNYIASGLVPRPQVLPPGPQDGAAPRIGYFPDDTIARVEAIQRLKREGWSIPRIAEHFIAHPPAAGSAPPAFQAAPPIPPLPTETASLFAAAPATTAAPAPTMPPARPAVAAAAPVAGTDSSPRMTPPAPAAAPAAPVVTPVAVLVSSLQDASGLWVKLSAEEYFELLNEVSAELDRILRRQRGLAGRRAGEVLVCYFLPQAEGSYLWNALATAQQTRDAMRQVSRRWQLRKGWDVELCMNIGVDEGQDWLGMLGAGPHAEPRVQGDAPDRAEQLSRCSRMGAILVTRNVLGKLPAEARDRLTYGVPRLDGPAGEGPLLFTFARLQDIAAPIGVAPRHADLAVAELLDLHFPPAVPAPDGAG